MTSNEKTFMAKLADLSSICRTVGGPAEELKNASSAGEGLGLFDKSEGVFDDTPPSDFKAEAAEHYQAAYRQANPSYAIS